MFLSTLSYCARILRSVSVRLVTVASIVALAVLAVTAVETGARPESDQYNYLAPCVAPSTVYVDDDFALLAPGDDPPGPATDFGCDSFATIQGGIAGVAGGGAVNVAAGTYTEIGQIAINKSLSIVGENKATTIVKPAQDTGNSGSGDARG